LAKTNYQFEKRQRDLAKKKKQEEKQQRRLAAKAPAEGNATGEPDSARSEAGDKEIVPGPGSGQSPTG
jgi:hypothetical protein